MCTFKSAIDEHVKIKAYSMNGFSIRHISAGVTAVIVGYSSAVVIVIDAAKRAGASDAMVVSWLLALGLGMGVTCIAFSWLTKMPVVTAWSTPGAAFLLTTVEQYSYSATLGAFVVCAFLSLITAQSRLLLKQISRIPPAISSALLAGILLPLCLAIFRDVNEFPYIVALFLGVYIAGSRLFPQYLMLMLLTLSLIVTVFMQGRLGCPDFSVVFSVPTPVWVTPTFSWSAAIGLGLPLFIITTLSQNLPGIAIHHIHGYFPDHKHILSGIAVVQGILAPFGGFTFNLAAITAAICMGNQVDNDKQQRYKAAIAAGIAYLIVGLCASAIVALFVSMPSVIIHLLAGLALLATLQGAFSKSMETPSHRAPALLTLLCTASGFSLLALPSAVWGIGLGLGLLFVQTKGDKSS
jgi:benzoate membrane transport protein